MSAPVENYFTKENNPAYNKTHPRRCQAKLAGGRVCYQWALKGIAYCKFHGGAAIKRQRENRTIDDPRTNDMGRIRKYKKLGATLTAFVEECLATPEHEQFDLREELAISQSFIEESAQLYEQAVNLPKDFVSKGGATRQDLIIDASTFIKKALDDVRVMSKTAADIHNQGKDKFSVFALADIIQQIKSIVHQVFGHFEGEMELFEEKLRHLQLPKVGEDGTTLTPDDDVQLMDMSVPAIEENTDTGEETTQEIVEVLNEAGYNAREIKPQ